MPGRYNKLHIKAENRKIVGTDKQQSVMDAAREGGDVVGVRATDIIK
jgi:hypothetical protein